MASHPRTYSYPSYPDIYDSTGGEQSGTNACYLSRCAVWTMGIIIIIRVLESNWE